MAKETIEEMKSESTGRPRSKKSTRATETDLDLSTAATATPDEGFSNHPHPATTELNASSDVETTSAPSFSREEIVGNIRDFASKAQDTLREQASGLREKFKDVPNTGREAMSKIDTSARENPWVAIGLAGVGALALGFLAARLFTKATEAAVAGYDFDQATDE